MTKKKAILVVLAAEVLIYLFILVALPALERIVGCGLVETAEWAWLIKVMPGLIGALLLALIWRQKMEVKDE